VNKPGQVINKLKREFLHISINVVECE